MNVELEPTQPGVSDAPGASAWRRARRRLVRTPAFLVASALLIIVSLAALFAPALTPYGSAEQDLLDTFAGISSDHWLGTDDLGRDVFTRLLYGARASLLTSLLVVGCAVLIAVPIGLVAGYVGGAVDNVLMRTMDALLSFPPLILALTIAGVLGPSLRNTVIALTIVIVPAVVRLVRGQALAVSEETFVEASRALGTPSPEIMGRRVFPSVFSALLVQISIMLGGVLLAEAGLSFLGLGVQLPEPSWGTSLRQAYDFIYIEPAGIVAPGLALAFTVLAFNTVGDTIRDALAPGSGQKRDRRSQLGVTSVVGPAAPNPGIPAGASPTVGGDADDAILELRDLRVSFETPDGPVTAVDGVSLTIRPGEIVGLVGESGSGKSVTSLSMMRLVPTPPGRITGGQVLLGGRDLLRVSAREMRGVRGREIAMVFQDPMTSLNPAYTVGNQLMESVRIHQPMSAEKARARSLELLETVGLNDPKARLSEYPHQLSGGMCQRVVIASALACDPKLLIADEPTTALDVTVQAQVLDLLRDLARDRGLAVLFVTHDLGVVAELCDRVAVMYAGQIVEEAPVDGLFASPRHPYTSLLLEAMPQRADSHDRLASIPGVVPRPDQMPPGCRFAPRCPYVRLECREPVELAVHDDRAARCVLPTGALAASIAELRA